jgi:hypothetical protein
VSLIIGGPILVLDVRSLTVLPSGALEELLAGAPFRFRFAWWLGFTN